MKKLAFLSVIILTGCANPFSAQNTTTLVPADQNQEIANVRSPEEIESISEIAQEEKTSYTCSGGNRFTLSYRAHTSGDAIMALGDNQFLLLDEQTSIGHVITESPQNPDRYSDETIALVFETPIHHEASVLKGETTLYSDCTPAGSPKNLDGDLPAGN